MLNIKVIKPLPKDDDEDIKLLGNMVTCEICGAQKREKFSCFFCNGKEKVQWFTNTEYD